MARKIKSEQAPHRAPLTRPEHVNSDDTVPDDTDSVMEIDESNEPVTGNGLKVLGSGVQHLVQEIQKLRHLGIEDLGLPLPKINVVGDQSAGKSSLIESLSEIKVPRATGTCTRCPMEINLTQNTNHTWRCRVMIHKKFTYLGRLKIEVPTKARPLGPWDRLQTSEDFNFAIIDSVSEVPRVLEWAQLAVLNPKDSYEAYAQGYASGGKPIQQPTVKFSPNVVRLDISGSNLRNLSFFDLPGVINVADFPEENYLVQLVENLVKEYVTAKDCINLLAISMTEDPANSSASRLLRDLKVDNKTIGCLTKPDRLMDIESLDQWMSILDGKKYRLGHGYFVIKNNKDPQVDHITARLEEADFFNNNEPWNDILQPCYKRFGIPQLQATLAELLTEQIKQSLPDFATKVKNKAAFIQDELDSLPEPIQGNITAIVMDELGRFSNELQKHIDGGSQKCPFQTQFLELATHFRKLLNDTRPIAEFRESSRRIAMRETSAGITTPTPTSGATAITIDSDAEDVSPATPTPISNVHRSGRKRPLSAQEDSPNKACKAEDNSDYLAISYPSRSFTLPGIREIVHRGYISLPGQVDPKAIEELIRLSMTHWKDIAGSFLDAVKGLCQRTVLKQVQEVFEHRKLTIYLDEILKICDDFLENVLAQYSEIASRILQWELMKPKTLNEQAMDEARHRALEFLISQRRKVLAAPYLKETERKTNKQSDISRDERLAKVPDEKLAPETYGPELNAIAETKAYYDIAYSRYVDNLCLSIHSEIFMRCREELVPHLKQKIGILEPDAHERLAVLLAVNPQDEQRRAILNKEKATAAQALKQLEALHK